MSFNPDTETPARVEITRVRNGFVLTTPPNFNRNEAYSIEDMYVFSSLDEVRDFLVERDFELTEE